MEISSYSDEDVSFFQKDLLCPDSDREHSVSPRRVRCSGDKPSLERKTCRLLFKKTYVARIMTEGDRFPPFGFDIAEISSNSNESISFLQEDLLCPDSDIESARFRVRHSGDKL